MEMTQTPGVYPFLLRFWGGHASIVADADGLVANDDGCHAVWFATREARAAFEARHEAAGVQHIVWDRHDHGEEDWRGEPADFGRFYVERYTMCGYGLHMPGWPVRAIMRLLTGHPDTAHSARMVLQFGCDSCERKVLLVRRSRCQRCEREADARFAKLEAPKGMED